MGSREIAELMERLELTQEGLAERLGVSQPTVSRWLRGLAHPQGLSLRELRKLAAEAGRQVA